jgi:hypothetical protein
MLSVSVGLRAQRSTNTQMAIITAISPYPSFFKKLMLLSFHHKIWTKPHIYTGLNIPQIFRQLKCSHSNCMIIPKPSSIFLQTLKNTSLNGRIFHGRCL